MNLSTQERRHITAVDDHQQHHVVAAIRRRDEFGIITRHDHGSTTLCGREVDTVLPYLPISTTDCCANCISRLHESMSTAIRPSRTPEEPEQPPKFVDTAFGRVARWALNLKKPTEGNDV